MGPKTEPHTAGDAKAQNSERERKYPESLRTGDTSKGALPIVQSAPSPVSINSSKNNNNNIFQNIFSKPLS